VEFEHLFAGIPVSERDPAVDFYERVTGRGPDLIPHAREAAWQLAPASWFYVVVDPSRAGSGLQTWLVADLDEFIAGVAGRGVAAGPVEIVGGGTRQTVLVDPDGNRLKVGQVPVT
jgi:predicted enzyme related to lactoylglutathione lyase